MHMHTDMHIHAHTYFHAQAHKQIRTHSGNTHTCPKHIHTNTHRNTNTQCTHVHTHRHTYTYKDEKQVFELLVSISCFCLDGVSVIVCTVALGTFSSIREVGVPSNPRVWPALKARMKEKNCEEPGAGREAVGVLYRLHLYPCPESASPEALQSDRRTDSSRQTAFLVMAFSSFKSKVAEVTIS